MLPPPWPVLLSSLIYYFYYLLGCFYHMHNLHDFIYCTSTFPTLIHIYILSFLESTILDFVKAKESKSAKFFLPNNTFLFGTTFYITKVFCKLLTQSHTCSWNEILDGKLSINQIQICSKLPLKTKLDLFIWIWIPSNFLNFKILIFTDLSPQFHLMV